jgi:hypothetical protein
MCSVESMWLFSSYMALHRRRAFCSAHHNENLESTIRNISRF